MIIIVFIWIHSYVYIYIYINYQYIGCLSMTTSMTNHLWDPDHPQILPINQCSESRYTQVPRILGPLVRTLDKLPEAWISMIFQRGSLHVVVLLVLFWNESPGNFIFLKSIYFRIFQVGELLSWFDVCNLARSRNGKLHETWKRESWVQIDLNTLSCKFSQANVKYNSRKSYVISNMALQNK